MRRTRTTRWHVTWAILATAFLLVMVPAVAQAQTKPIPDPPTVRDQVRLVCEDQIVWTRLMTLGVLHDLQPRDAYMQRLLHNYDVIEDLLLPYYGDGAEEFGELFERHIVLAQALVTELRNGGDFDTVLKDWYANGDDLAALMDELNPAAWPLKDGEYMWWAYLNATYTGMIAHYMVDPKAEVEAYDLVHTQMMRMADFLANGITPVPRPTVTPRKLGDFDTVDEADR